jgi:hypothetical protein
MAVLAHPSIQLSVRRDILDIGNRPVPHDANAILDVLLMARVAINFIVRALFPGLPRGSHQVARGAKIGIVFDVMVSAITAKRDSHNH